MTDDGGLRAPLSAEELHQLMLGAIGDIFGVAPDVEQLQPSEHWYAGVRLSAGGRTCEVASNDHLHEVRFVDEGMGAVVVSEGGRDEIGEYLTEFVRAAREYLAGRYAVRQKRWWIRSTPTLFLTTETGEWEVARRRSLLPT